MDIFKREVFRQKTVITLRVHTLDASNARSVSRRVAEAMKDVRQMVVDLGSLRYFDLAGFAVILKWASNEGPDVRFCSQCGAVQALFELLGGNAMIPLFFSREEAMASFQTAVNHQTRAISELTDCDFDEDQLDARRAV